MVKSGIDYLIAEFPTKTDFSVTFLDLSVPELLEYGKRFLQLFLTEAFDNLEAKRSEWGSVTVMVFHMVI